MGSIPTFASGARRAGRFDGGQSPPIELPCTNVVPLNLRKPAVWITAISKLPPAAADCHASAAVFANQEVPPHKPQQTLMDFALPASHGQGLSRVENGETAAG